MTATQKSVTVAVAWLVLGLVMAISAALLDLSLNLFDWQGKWSFGAVAACLLFASALGATFFLHRETSGALPMLVAVIVTLSLFALGALHLPPETREAGAFLGRTRSSPLAYRVAFASALALPALLLGVRRWQTDGSDRWFRRRAPWLAPPLATLGLALLASGLAGRRANDPEPYQSALDVLGGPSALQAFADLALAAGQAVGRASSIEELLVPEILEQRMREHSRTPAGTREAEHHERLERFLAADDVPAAIRDEVRNACAAHASSEPVRAHSCARDVLSAARQRAERRRRRYGWLGAIGVPFAAAALALSWRARRPRPSLA